MRHLVFIVYGSQTGLNIAKNISKLQYNAIFVYYCPRKRRSTVFSIVAVFFSVNTIADEPLHLA